MASNPVPDPEPAYFAPMTPGGLQPVAASSDLAAGPVRVVLDGVPWVLARLDGRVVAARDRCPHRGYPLSAGTVEDGCLTCPYHGWRYDADGRAVEIPALGRTDAPLPPRARLRLAPAVEEHDGLVWMDPGEPEPEPPRLVMANDDVGLRRGWHPVCRSEEIQPGGSLAVELLGEQWLVERTAPEGEPVAVGAYAAVDHLGHVWIAPEEPVTGLLEVGEFAEAGWRRVPMPRIEGRYGVGLLLDNQLDAGHFSFVHRNTFGSADGAALPPYTVERNGNTFEAVLRVPISARNDVDALDGARPLQQHRTMTYRYAAPTTLWLRLDYEQMGGSTGILFCFTPLTAERTRVDIDLLFQHPDGFTEEQLA
ncbi:MAG: Rieske (2Fe-2S) iron-sulfur domain protein, partial [Actinomycetia bacterium]|nr:Rieske (2Fe-2S) iron-sulfur domain protein [Actinomycetes bacterium]